MKKSLARLVVVGIAGAAFFGIAGTARAGGSCPNTVVPQAGAGGVSYAADPGPAKTCGELKPNGQGHVWVTGGGGLGTDAPTSGKVNGFYVAVGTDRVGNPDGGRGTNTGCSWNPGTNGYTGSSCPPRAKSGPYACVATAGGPAYGPSRGVLVCPVNQ